MDRCPLLLHVALPFGCLHYQMIECSTAQPQAPALRWHSCDPAFEVSGGPEVGEQALAALVDAMVALQLAPHDCSQGQRGGSSTAQLWGSQTRLQGLHDGMGRRRSSHSQP